MGGFMSAPKAPAPPPPPAPPPTQDDAAVKAAAEEEKRRLLAAKGRADSLLTSGEGDTSAAETAKKTLLGS